MPKSRQRKKKAALSTSKLPPLPALDPEKLEALEALEDGEDLFPLTPEEAKNEALREAYETPYIEKYGYLTRSIFRLAVSPASETVRRPPRSYKAYRGDQAVPAPAWGTLVPEQDRVSSKGLG
jgi:hypothetical protein